MNIAAGDERGMASRKPSFKANQKEADYYVKDA
jgi:hypothetical protein